MVKTIDLNSDLGESFSRWRLGNDEEVMKYITSANVACGFHASDPLNIRSTVKLAKQHNVAVGAHVGLPDLLGFGRRVIQITPDDSRDYVLYQIGALKAFAEATGLKLQHVKPHGAFWDSVDTSVCQQNEDAARAAVEAMLEVDKNLIFLGASPHYTICKVAQEMGVRYCGELYVDLDYYPDGRLILERTKQPKSPKQIADIIVQYVDTGKRIAVDGSELVLEAKSVCVHGDGPNAPDLLRSLREELRRANVEVVPFGKLV